MSHYLEFSIDEGCYAARLHCTDPVGCPHPIPWDGMDPADEHACWYAHDECGNAALGEAGFDIVQAIQSNSIVVPCTPEGADVESFQVAVAGTFDWRAAEWLLAERTYERDQARTLAAQYAENGDEHAGCYWEEGLPWEGQLQTFARRAYYDDCVELAELIVYLLRPYSWFEIWVKARLFAYYPDPDVVEDPVRAAFAPRFEPEIVYERVPWTREAE